MKQQTTNKSTMRCSQCGSSLIQVTQVTETVEGSRFPQTSTTYRCSNEECQSEIDSQTAKRVKLQKDKELATEQKLKLKLQVKN